MVEPTVTVTGTRSTQLTRDRSDDWTLLVAPLISHGFCVSHMADERRIPAGWGPVGSWGSHACQLARSVMVHCLERREAEKLVARLLV